MPITDTGIAYDDRGPRSDRAYLCLPGWAVSRSFFTPLAERLARDSRVITLDWRNHGDSRRGGDFGHAELLEDALAVIDACGAPTVVPIAQAHGGWIALALRARLGDRVPAIVASSWMVFEPPPPFTNLLATLQDPERWQTGRDQLFAMWLDNAPDELAARVRADMGSYDAAMWARAGREISAEYARHASPLRVLAASEQPPRFVHLFSQPRAPEALAAQDAFARDHAWFAVRRIDAVSHFPPLEAPDATAAAITELVRV